MNTDNIFKWQIPATDPPSIPKCSKSKEDSSSKPFNKKEAAAAPYVIDTKWLQKLLKNCGR